MLYGIPAGTVDTDELRNEDGVSFARVAAGDITLPVGIAESKWLEHCSLIFGGGKASLDDGFVLFVVHRGEVVQVHFHHQVGGGQAP